MGIEVALHHRTEYRYDRRIALGPQTVRLRPAPHCRTPIPAYSLKAEPKPHFVNWQQDPQGNFLARIVFPEKTDRMVMTVDLVADMAVINPFDFFLEPAAENIPLRLRSGAGKRAGAVPPRRRRGPAARALPARRRPELSPHHRFPGRAESQAAAGHPLHRPARARRPDARGDAGARRRLVPRQRLAAGAAPAPSRLRRALRLGLPDPARRRPEAARGSGRAERRFHRPPRLVRGLSARRRLDRPRPDLGAARRRRPYPARLLARAAKRRADLRHAGALRDGAGPCHVGAAACRDAARHQALCRGGMARLSALGERIDRDLAAQDVRLTMGGEPTFVAAADPDGAEWNTDALGPTKRVYAGKLLRRLADRFATGYLLHYGQGKWYPGEQLPRWALACHWRARRRADLARQGPLRRRRDRRSRARPRSGAALHHPPGGAAADRPRSHAARL